MKSNRLLHSHAKKSRQKTSGRLPEAIPVLTDDMLDMLPPGPITDTGRELVRIGDRNQVDRVKIKFRGGRFFVHAGEWSALRRNTEIYLTTTDRKILAAMQERKPLLLDLYDLNAATGYSRRTIGPRLKYLIKHGFACRPLGPRHGATITDKGERILATTPLT